jgi:RNA-directed DNA polymerase
MAEANSPRENVRALQRGLYVAAKQNGKRKFPALLDRIARLDVLRHAWEQVRSNRGSAGIDGETLQAVMVYGVERMLEELRELLLAGRYRPQPSRRVCIPKPGRPGEERPLSIPRVRDRVAQTAAKLVLEPIFEASFLPTSFGFRPKRGAHQALELIRKTVNQGARWVVDLDFKDYLEPSPHYPSVCSDWSGIASNRPAWADFEFGDLDSEALAPPCPHVHRTKLAALYTLQHGLSRDSQRVRGLQHR